MRRRTIPAKLRHCRASGQPVIDDGIGLGLIVPYNSGRYRMAECGSMVGPMPYDDANAIALEPASEVLPIIRHTPVLVAALRRTLKQSAAWQLIELANRISDPAFGGSDAFPQYLPLI